MKTIKLTDKRNIGIGEKPYFIAEVGINHNGSFETACKLIDLASYVGIDCVKFQKRDFEKSIVSDYLDKPYIYMNSFGRTYREHKNFLEFSETQLLELSKYSDEKGIAFACSAFDIGSFTFIEDKISPPFHKIASPLTVNHDLLKRVASFQKPMFISTGMTTYDEIARMIDIILPINDRIVLLQCTSLYPTDNDEVNLRVVKSYQRDFNVLVGFSSHDRSVVFPSAAMVFGACVFEKHITLDRTMKGPDHSSSFEKRGLELCYNYLLATYDALGSMKKQIQPREMESREKHMQSIVSMVGINKNTKLKEEHITFKSPGTGLMPYEKLKIIGRKANRDIKVDEILTEKDFY